MLKESKERERERERKELNNMTHQMFIVYFNRKKERKKELKHLEKKKTPNTWQYYVSYKFMH